MVVILNNSRLTILRFKLYIESSRLIEIYVVRYENKPFNRFKLAIA